MSPLDVIREKLTDCPDWLRTGLTELLQDGEQVVMAFISDMSLEGRYEAQALCVTDHRLLTLQEAAGPPVRELDLGQVALVRLKRFMGNGILLVTTWNENVEAVRYSATLAAVMEDFKTNLESYLVSRLEWSDPEENQGKVGHVDEEETTAEAAQNSRRCPQCGCVLPPDRESCTACTSRRTILRRMLSYLRPHLALVSLSFLLTVSVAATGAVVPWLGKRLIDDAILVARPDVLRVLLMVLGGVFLGRAIASGVRRYVTTRLSQEVIHDLRRGVYGHLQRLSQDFFDRQSTGRLISRVTNDTSRLQMFAVGGLQQFLVDIVLLAMVLAWMLSYSVQLTLLLWVPVPLLYFAVKWYHRRVHRVYRKAWRKMAGISEHLADTIPGIQLVKGFSQEDREIERFSGRIVSFKEEYLRATVFSAKFSTCVLLLTQVGTLTAYWAGGVGAMASTGGAGAGVVQAVLHPWSALGGLLLGTQLSVGELVMFMGWMGIMYAPVHRFSALAESFENASTSAARVFEVLDTEPTISANAGGGRLDKVQGDIRFQNVNFNYEAGPPILKNISFTVKAGETIGVVGPSGSGKSTLIKLLCRYYDPSRGQILIDGQDLSKINLASYRRMLGIVEQSPFLFGESITENIRYGKPEADAEDVLRAARAANAHEFIMLLPEGYDTEARERGSRFSGGERQRICIARAILKDPAILILDEATSAVDTRNEKLIQNALDQLITGRTTFIIAHRLSTLRNADKILVLEDGELLDIGSHTELVHRCKTYAELVKTQTELDHALQPVA